MIAIIAICDLTAALEEFPPLNPLVTVRLRLSLTMNQLCLKRAEADQIDFGTPGLHR